MSQSPKASGSGGGQRSWRIGLVVDHPRRDLEGLVLLARELLALGQNPMLVPMYQQGTDQALLGLDGLVVNYCRANNVAALQEWRRDGLVTFVLDTEGGVLSASGHRSPEGVALSLAELDTAKAVDGYLFWGPRLAEAVLAKGALPAERVAVTGCPRFDLCAEPWRRRLGPRRGDYVLINTNYSLINPAQTRSAEREVHAMLGSGWPTDYVHTLVRDLLAVFTACLDCMDNLTAALPRQKFRLRPHPFEDLGVYLKRFSNRANVEVNGEGSVASAIQRAACVLHLNCGSAVEAAMLERVPVQLEFLNTPVQREHTPLPGRLSRRVASLDDLIALLLRPASVAEGFDLAAVVERELQPFFGKLDGRAYERSAAFIVGRMDELRTGHRARSLSLALGSGRRSADAGQVAQGVLGTVLGTSAAARVREAMQPARKIKRLELSDIGHLMKEFDSCKAGAPAIARRARHPLTGLPLESVGIELATLQSQDVNPPPQQ